MKKTTLKRVDRTRVWRKDDDLLPQEKCVTNHDGCFINRCQVRLCEDNQVYIPSSTLPALRYKKNLLKLLTHIHSCWTHEKKKNSTATLWFHWWRKKMFSVSSCQREEYFGNKSSFCANIIISWRQDYSLEHPVLKHSWLASKACTSARRRRWEWKQREEQYRTFLTNLRKQDLPSCSCDSRSIVQGHEENSSASFFSSHRSQLQLLEKPDSSENLMPGRDLQYRKVDKPLKTEDSDVTLALWGFNITELQIRIHSRPSKVCCWWYPSCTEIPSAPKRRSLRAVGYVRQQKQNLPSASEE